jgi:hypothetical protein
MTNDQPQQLRTLRGRFMDADAAAMECGGQAARPGAVPADPLVAPGAGLDTACAGRSLEQDSAARNAGGELQAEGSTPAALVDSGHGVPLPRPLDARGFLEIVVGYLVTLPDGHECRMPADKTRVELYAAKNHATIEPIYVKRSAR